MFRDQEEPGVFSLTLTDELPCPDGTCADTHCALTFPGPSWSKMEANITFDNMSVSCLFVVVFFFLPVAKIKTS